MQESLESKLVEDNLGLLPCILRRYYGTFTDDMLQEARIGLLMAVRKYREDKNCKLSSYATSWVRGKVSRHLRYNKSLIRYPENVAEKLERIDRRCGENPDIETSDDISAATGIPVDEVEDVLNSRNIVYSLSSKIASDSAGVFQDIIPDESGYPGNAEDLLRIEVSEALDGLEPRTAQVIRMRFGLEPYDARYTLREIAAELGVTHQWVSMLEKDGMNFLRNKLMTYAR